MKIISLALSLILSLSAAAQTTRPRIIIAVDAQPISNMDRVKALGANALHRFDSGPAKNTLLSTWIKEADSRGIFTIIQATAADAQGVDLATLPKTVIAISQDDESNLNRWPYTGTPAQQAQAATWLYTPTNAPHPSVVGTVLPTITNDRYVKWKSKTTLPVMANLAGPPINSGWYKPDLIYDKGYLASADILSADVYPCNTSGTDPPTYGYLYWPANVTDKLSGASGKPVWAYVECAFGRGQFKRGPTPAEQSVLTWSQIGHGARGLTFFPQCVNPPFSYWAMTPENEAAAKADIAGILSHADLICDGKLTVVQTPKVQNSNYTAPGGKLVWADSEAFTWTLGTEQLVVSVNYKTPGVTVTYTAPPVSTPPPTLEDRVKALEAWRKS